MSGNLPGAAGDPWLALGLELRLVTTADGGRQTPVLLAEPLRYRPNWGLPGMTGAEQAGAPVLCSSASQIAPGGQALVVIIPLSDHALPRWRQVRDGDELRMFEGARICGHATVLWAAPTRRPLPAGDRKRFRDWVSSWRERPESA
jgi:hypothetical protein